MYQCSYLVLMMTNYVLQWRDYRSIHQNIMPATTGACKALWKVMPRVKDKLSGLAFRVPIVNVSVLDLSIRLNVHTSIQEIMESARKASKEELKNILDISKEQTVSSDFIGNSHSCILDMESSMQLNSKFFKLVCWYDNEYSYACRVIDMIYVSERQLQTDKISRSPVLKKNSSIHENVLSRKMADISISQDTSLKYKLVPDVDFSKNPLCLVKKDFGIHDFRKKSNESDISNDIRHDKAYQQSKEHLEYAHERLDILKKELSKMVTITKKLLTKSFLSSKSSTKSGKKLHNNTGKVGNEILKNEKKREIAPKYLKHLKSGNVCLPTDRSVDTSNDNQFEINDRIKLQLHSHLDEGGHNNKRTPLRDSTKNIIKMEQLRNQIILDESKRINIINNPKERNSTNNIHNIKVQYSVIHKELMNNEALVCNNNDKEEYVTNYTKDNLHHMQKCNSNTILANNSGELGDNKNSNKPVHTSVLVIPNIKMKSETQMNCDYDTQKLGLKQISILSEETLNNGSPSTSIAIRNVAVYRHKEDIYDKLESCSNSNHSFQTSERSQIINITELASSLDDLAQLDKICKIIEISDELSNKLFSVLDSETMDIKNKKWSFKDLCEKIKLDEFCGDLIQNPQI
ncbi:hypothetical protein ACJJTC_002501 [Scirpophaga incertulas]